MLTPDQIKRACYEAMKLGKIADWRFKGMPVLQWEFATISDYARARADLLRALEPELRLMVRDHSKLVRRVSDEVEELDCFGVTFRLICRQKMMTRGGPFGAADISR